MPRYIDISDIHIPKGIFEGINVPKLLAWLESLPTADVEEVRHGEWEDNKVAFYRMCSECGCGVRSRRDVVLLNFIDHQYYYCPNCGAKMDGKEINE